MAQTGTETVFGLLGDYLADTRLYSCVQGGSLAREAHRPGTPDREARPGRLMPPRWPPRRSMSTAAAGNPAQASAGLDAWCRAPLPSPRNRRTMAQTALAKKRLQVHRTHRPFPAGRCIAARDEPGPGRRCRGLRGTSRENPNPAAIPHRQPVRVPFRIPADTGNPTRGEYAGSGRNRPSCGLPD
jgi:hypothetical protein